jgi:hypothetical protein
MVLQNTTDNEVLSDKQRMALIHIVGNHTIEQGCKEAGISRDCFYRWLENPLFKAELSRPRETIFIEAIDHLKHSMKLACHTLKALCEDPECPPAVKRGAATDIIGHLMKWRETQELEKRITQLEEHVKGAK